MAGMDTATASKTTSEAARFRAGQTVWVRDLEGTVTECLAEDLYEVRLPRHPSGWQWPVLAGVHLRGWHRPQDNTDGEEARG